LDAIEGGPEARGEITRLLLEAGEGDRQALDRVLPLVYEQLKTIARQRLRAEKADLTLDTTGLVHEAYLKLVDQSRVQWKDRGHFFRVAAMAMRRILVDRARRHLAEKRGAGAVRLPLESASLSLEDRAGAILEVEDALTRLAAVDERLARVVECRFFGGLTEEETAEAMGVTARTIRREWVKAKELLRQLLSGGRAGGEVERDAP
jgi:RNA polymerase sigma factor (TIGR02999 family)